jgi:hypothetical protein
MLYASSGSNRNKDRQIDRLRVFENRLIRIIFIAARKQWEAGERCIIKNSICILYQILLERWVGNEM